jgi:hypothetical protein
VAGAWGEDGKVRDSEQEIFQRDRRFFKGTDFAKGQAVLRLGSFTVRHWVLDAIYREDHNQTLDRNAAANLGTLRRMSLNAHNRMPAEGKKPKSLPKRELRAAQDEAYLEKLLSLM